MTSRVRLSPELRERLIEHALSSPGEEVCGLLGGNVSGLNSVYPVRNIANKPQSRFLMSPEEQIAAIRVMRKRGETLAGIYHSHPDTEAVPSNADIELAAYPDVYYFIISLAKPRPELKCYILEGNVFNEVPISETSD